MKTLTLALSTTLMVGLMAPLPLAQDSSTPDAATRVAGARRVAAAQVHQVSHPSPRHAPAKNPGEERAHARRLAEYRAWQQSQADQKVRTEQSRQAHKRRAKAVAARRQAAGQHSAPTQPGPIALERMARMRSQGIDGATRPQSTGQQRLVGTHSPVSTKSPVKRTVKRPAVRPAHKKAAHRSSRSRNR